VVGWDTEDDSKGTPLLFGFTHERGSYSTASADDALEWLVTLAKAQKLRGHVVEAWATNLEYDLVNLFGVDRLREVFFQFGRSHLCGARWRGVEFRDTLRHVPASVEELGKLVGLEKVESNLFADRSKITERKLVARLMRDATITFRAAKLIHKTYKIMGDRPRLTLPATAYQVWLNRFWKAPVYGPVPEILESAREAYFGGRTEAFALGTFKDVKVIDAASMFPWAMVQGKFPIPWRAFRRALPDDTPRADGLYFARVESALKIPLLPYRSVEGNVFPNGKWRGWYVGEELQAFARAGGRVRVLRGFEFFEQADPFKGYVRNLFGRKQRARGPMRSIYKLLLNSLYGKFGQQGGRVRCLTLEKFQALPRGPIDFRVWNGLVIFSEDGPPPPWGNNLWAAIITARARLRLHQEFLALQKGGARVLYCDTDSAIYSGPARRYAEAAAKPGEFESRGEYRSVRIEGKKEYGLEDHKGRWEVHIKGVPAREREKYLLTGKAKFERPTRLREAARRDLQPNVWRTHTKERRVTHRNRTRSAGGYLLPLEIEE